MGRAGFFSNREPPRSQESLFGLSGLVAERKKVKKACDLRLTAMSCLPLRRPLVSLPRRVISSPDQSRTDAVFL